MPLVFIHGVNVRQGPSYERELAFRNRHFVDVLYQQLGREVRPEAIFSPYWGDLGANLSPGLPFLPRGDYKLLWQKRNQKDESVDPPRSEELSETPLLDIARTASVDEVVDLLFELAEREMLESGTEQQHSQQEMDALARRALDFAHRPEGEKWLSGLKSDDELVARLAGLLHESDTRPSTRAANGLAEIIRSTGQRLRGRLGESRERLRSQHTSLRTRLGEDISDARLRFRQSLVATTAHMLNEPLRALFHAQCALLIGDAFAYFSSRGDHSTPAPIAMRVIDALSDASKMAKESSEELIVIGHSMGGVILCDIVTCYGKDIPIDVLITVGSQFPLFADLGMFPGVVGDHPIAAPTQVKRWLNIFDPHDFLGYPASHLFSGIDDFHLPTYAVGASAHADYFNRRSFYFHLARRIADYLPPRVVPAK